MKKLIFIKIPVLFLAFIFLGAGILDSLLIIPYEKSLLTAREKALTTGKDVLIFFASDKCPDCKKIEDVIENDAQINKLVDQKFLCARINVDNFDGRATQQRYSVQKLPAIVILDASGKIKSKIENITVNSDIKSFIRTTPVYTDLDNTTFQSDEVSSTSKTEVNKSKPTQEVVAGSFYIQIGVFGSEENAKASMEKLVQQGFPNASYFSEYVNEKEIFRVTGGSNLSKEEADQLIAKLKELEITGLLRKH